MKINLTFGPDIRNHDFLNVGPAERPDLPPDIYRAGDWASLDWLTMRSSVEEIVADNILQFVARAGVETVLRNWISQLKPGGILRLTIPDLDQIAQAILDRTAPPETISQMLWGDQKSIMGFVRSGLTAQDLRIMLEKIGLRIERMSLGNLQCHLEAWR